MTQKDYAKFAELMQIAQARYGRDTGKACEAVQFFKIELANLFEQDHGRFDRERFYQACKPKVRK